MPAEFFREMVRALEPSGWRMSVLEDREVVETGFRTESGRVALVVQAHSSMRAVGVVAEAETEVPRPFVPKTAELLMRTNLQLNLGNFEMDWDAGRVFFRLSNLFPDKSPDSESLEGMVRLAVIETDRLSRFLAVLLAAPPDDLAAFDVPRLMRRTDLLPASEEESD